MEIEKERVQRKRQVNQNKIRVTRAAKAVLVFTVLLMALCGCTGKEKIRVAEIADVVQIPADGVITKEQFAAFAKTDRVIAFEGKDKEIAYTWEFSGSMINNPEDMNLSVTVIAEKEKLSSIKKLSGNAPYAIGFSLQEGSLVAAPTLRLVLDQAWNADVAVLCLEEDGKAAKVSDAAIMKEQNKTVLEVTITEVGKTYYIVAGNSGQKEIEEGIQEESQEESQEQNQEEKEGSTIVKEDEDVPQPTNSSTEKEEDNKTEKKEQKEQETKKPQNQKLETNKPVIAAATKSPENGTQGNKKDEAAVVASKKPVGTKTPTATKQPVVVQTETPKKEEEKEQSMRCTISISCASILKNMGNLKPGKEEFVPKDGWILSSMQVEVKQGESVYDVLVRVCREKRIHMEHEYFPIYQSQYIEGINQLYERDCGSMSGWTYKVNGWKPNYGCDKYILKDGDRISWEFTCG